MTIALVLDAERERRGFTLAKLAEASGVPLGSVHSILRGKTPNPGILTVVAILDALGKSLSWLDREQKK